jgi:hypothetical protein
MAIKFTVKEEPKAAPVTAARKSSAEADGNGPAGATHETPPAAAVGTDLFNAEPAASRKRRKK